MGLANAVKGGLRPSQQVTWLREDGAPENLVGATLTGTISDPHTGTTAAIAGTLNVTDGANGVFTWAYGAADVAVAGTFEVQFSAAFGSAPTPAKTFIAPWTVADAR